MHATHRRSTEFRQELRAATASSHERVDTAFSRFKITNEAGYRAFLAAHNNVLPGCERDLEASSASILMADWLTRVRAPELQVDMAEIGAISRANLPAVTILSPAEGFGMMYVLEGSRLGGAILAKRLDGNPVARCRHATRYLMHGHGLKLWPSFIAALEASTAVQDDPDAIIRSAIATFARFETAAADGWDVAA